MITGTIGGVAGVAGNIAAQFARNGGSFECFDVSDGIIAGGVGFLTGFVAPVAAPGLLGAVGLGGIASVAQIGLSNSANGMPISGQDVLVSAGIGAVAGLIGGGIGYPPSDTRSDLISAIADPAFDRVMNEAARMRHAVGGSNLFRSTSSSFVGNTNE